MPTVRRFTAFKKDAHLPRINDIPDGGFCISAFIIISKRGNPHEVLMGHLNRESKWDYLGALYASMVEKHSKGWMLPSSPLIFGESPHEAAQRILLEQLGLNDQKLEEPRVFSEVYGRGHWDLEFLFLGERDRLPTHPAWRELRFVDLTSTRKEDIARSHEDILAHAGKWKTTQ